MHDPLPSTTISVAINRDPATVYSFASNPENLSSWATGFGSTVEQRDGQWIVQTPAGPASIRFAEPNSFGVMDHRVTQPSGQEVYVPVRVVANDSGSKIAFTIFRMPGMSDDDHARDVEMVRRDLETLKHLLKAG